MTDIIKGESYRVRVGEGCSLYPSPLNGKVVEAVAWWDDGMWRVKDADGLMHYVPKDSLVPVEPTIEERADAFVKRYVDVCLKRWGFSPDATNPLVRKAFIEYLKSEEAGS